MTRPKSRAARIVEGVRFVMDDGRVWRATLADGRRLWAWNAGPAGDPTWHYGDTPGREDRNRGTRGDQRAAMADAVAWAEGGA